MSQSQRQSNLFAAEEFTSIYKSFKNVDFRAYDFDTLKQSMVNYIQLHYPEDFNDYIESSEYIAMIELLAYLGTSLSFRMDLDTRNNFIDTAERRESVISLAKMVNYQAKRNIAANGMFKITGVQTTENVTDSLGRNLSNRTVFWNDANNVDSYDQFTSIVNSAFSNSNPFGKPSKRGTVAGIPTDLYQLENVRNIQVTYPVQITVNNENLPFDICNVDFDDNNGFFERHPDPSTAFNIAYRNDGQGFGSPTSGFFLFFKQGELLRNDVQYDYPIKNRIQELPFTNINNSDVYVQEINSNGDVQKKWTKVEYTNGNESVFFNNIASSERSIYSVTTGLNDSISIQYPDGNFGEVPTGIFRTWARKSSNTKFTMRPKEVNNLEISIPYIGKDSQNYILRILFSLEDVVSNSSPSETNDEIKTRAPQVYYTQNRMVNAQDYNTFPMSISNSILKLRTLNRTHAGHSRYIDINDPTGFHQNLSISADDGAIYKDPQIPYIEVNYDPDYSNPTVIVTSNLTDFMKDRQLTNFFYESYVEEYRRIRKDTWVNTSTYNKYNVFEVVVDNVTWKTSPSTVKNNTGFIDIAGATFSVVTGPYNDSLGGFRFIDVGCKIKYVESPTSKNFLWATVLDITSATGDLSLDGKLVTLDVEVSDGWSIKEVLPTFRKVFDLGEESSIVNAVSNLSNFGLVYSLDVKNSNGTYGSWFLQENINPDDTFLINASDRNWLVRSEFSADTSGSTYEFRSRGVRYIFESYSDIRFYSDSSLALNYNVQDMVAEMDEIEILSTNVAAGSSEYWEYDVLTGWTNGQNVNMVYPAGYVVLKDRGVDSGSVLALLSTQQNGVSDISSLASNGVLNLSSVSGLLTGDSISVSYSNISETLLVPVKLNLLNSVYETNGTLNSAKVEVIPADSNRDGVPDEPYPFKRLIDNDGVVFFELVPDEYNASVSRLWETGWKDIRFVATVNTVVPMLNQNTSAEILTYDELKNENLFLVTEAQLTAFKDTVEFIMVRSVFAQEVVNAEYELSLIDGNTVFVEIRNSLNGEIVVNNTSSTTVMISMAINREESAYTNAQQYYSANKAIIDAMSSSELTAEVNAYMSSNTRIVLFSEDSSHSVKIGRSFTLDTNVSNPAAFDYKWKHIAPTDNRIDPSISNVMDMLVLTSQYYDDVITWKNKGLGIDLFPTPPTTETLRVSFSELNDYKMMTDQLVFSSAKFRILFGAQASDELKAKFKVVKVPSSMYTDNEVKTRVIKCIDDFFSVDNWDFGETFYFTELAGYIHTQLAGIVASVVIVPQSRESQFGNMFEIRALPSEMFISTATVSDVEIINTLTETNMRL